MSFDQEELEEFKSEALDLIEEAEKNLLEVERGQEFRPRYDAVFRCFHSLKGAAGMLELETLRNHMHHLEDLFAKYKDSDVLTQNESTFFLNGIDAARKIVSGENVKFEFYIPGEDKISPAEVSIKDQSPQKVDIFIVDDEPELVEILGVFMTKAKYTWKGFTKPKEAVEALNSYEPKLVMSDLKMPEINGLEMMAEVRAYSKDIPFIIISAQLSKEALLEAISRGVSGVIEKPFRESQVAAQVTQSLYQAELRELLNKTIEVLMFQMPDLEEFLKQKGKTEILSILKKDIESLLSKRRLLNTPKQPDRK